MSRYFGQIARTGAISLLLFVACSPERRAAEPQKPVPQKSLPAKPAVVRVGYLPIAAELPLFVAIEKGYFRDAGVTLELTRFTSSNELGRAANAGKVDLAAGTALNVVFDIGTVSDKRDLLFAVNPYSNTPGHVTDHLLVRANSPVKSLRQLKGKRVASFPGSVNRIFTELILAKHGVPKGSYTYSELTPPNWQPALASGSVDAISALEPQATQIIQDGVGRSIFPGFYADVMADVPLSGHWMAADFVRRGDRAQIAAIVKAYQQAIAFCRDHEADAKQFLPKYAGVRADTLPHVNLNPWKVGAEIDATNIQRYVDLLASHGAIQKAVDVKQYLLPPQ